MVLLLSSMFAVDTLIALLLSSMFVLGTMMSLFLSSMFAVDTLIALLISSIFVLGTSGFGGQDRTNHKEHGDGRILRTKVYVAATSQQIQL